MYASILPFAGPQPFNDWFDPDTTQRHVLGLRLSGVDPYWGYGSFVYAKAAAAQEKGSLVYLANGNVATDVPNTANTGLAVLVAMAPMAQDEFGWYMDVGTAILSATASVAALAAVGVTGAGQVGANTAGKQLLGYTNQVPGTATKVINGTKRAGSPIIVTSGYDGWWLGVALTGTGVPASTKVAKLDPDGRTVYMGSAVGTVDKLSTTTDTVAITGTYTGFLVGHIANANVQGAIT